MAKSEERTTTIATRVAVLVGSLLACSTTMGTSADDSIIRTEGRIHFDVYEGAVCGDAGPSPVGRCSRAIYTGGLDGKGDTAIQRMEPLLPEGMFFVSETEVLRLADGELHSRVNAVFNSKSPERELASLHTILDGTGRYAGASGHIRLWRTNEEVIEYVAVIHLGAVETAP